MNVFYQGRSYVALSNFPAPEQYVIISHSSYFFLDFLFFFLDFVVFMPSLHSVINYNYKIMVGKSNESWFQLAR